MGTDLRRLTFQLVKRKCTFKPFTQKNLTLWKSVKFMVTARSRDCVVSTVSMIRDCRSRFRILVSLRGFCSSRFLNGRKVHPVSYPMATGYSFLDSNGLGVRMATDLLVLKLRVSRAVDLPPFPPYAFVACKGVTLRLLWYNFPFRKLSRTLLL
jgi:hypothetical protein